MSERSIAVLEVHREKLLGTKTFEEYRDAHVAYIDMLIEQLEADLAKDNSIKRWVVKIGGEASEVSDDRSPVDVKAEVR